MSKLAHEEIRKREVLKRILDDDMYPEAIQSIRQQLQDAILRSNDRDERERFYQEASLLNRFQSTLEGFATELLFLDTKKRDEEAA